MKKILVCQHVPYEILGTLNPQFKDHGFRIRYVNFGRFPDLQPSLEDYNGLVILGGPMSTDQTSQHPHLLHEIRMIESAMKMDIPILGICLGSQLIAKALGATVGRNREKEIGWHEVSLTEEGKRDPLLSHFNHQEKIFQWHQDTFVLPAKATHLASSELCSSQAFRYGNKVYGFQFHLEVDEAMIEHWLHLPRHQDDLESVKGKMSSQQIRMDTQQHVHRLKELSAKTFGEFIKLFGVQKKFRCPPSR